MEGRTDGGAIYAGGTIGAWVYFWQLADGFWPHLFAIIQGLLWPAWIVYRGLKALG